MGVFNINYSSTRACFIKKLQVLLEDEYEDFGSLDRWRNCLMCYIYIYIGSELWPVGE